jgi:hypothetical protein
MHPDDFEFAEGDIQHMDKDAAAGLYGLPPVQHINPLQVFPHLAKKASMPARRILFTDTESDTYVDQNSCDTVDEYAIYPPPPSHTPSSDHSLSDFHFLMASVMKGSLTGGSMRKPLETSSELNVTMNLASKGLEECLDEVSDDEESSFRHPPRWTRKQNILNTSGTLDFGNLAPNRHPTMMETSTHAVMSTGQWEFISSCSKEKVLPAVPRPIMKALAARSSGATQGVVRQTSDDSALPAGLCLDVSSRNLGDKGIRALSAAFPMLDTLQSLNVAGNCVSCRAMSRFLSTCIPASAASLKSLDLSRNQHIGEGTLDTLVDLIDNGSLRALETLSMSGIDLPEKQCVALLESLTNGGTLLTLNMADTRLGGRSACGPQPSIDAMGKLISDGAVTSLDISGNFVRREGAAALAIALEATETLEVLDFSYNANDQFRWPAEPSGEGEGESGETILEEPTFAPILLICEGLLRNATLRTLCLSHCSLDYTADFMLAEAMLHHPLLSDIDLSSNPHGSLGLGCLLRAAGVSHSKVRGLCVTDVRRHDVANFAVVYNARDPSGPYTLQLAHPQHRSLLRTLLDRPTQNGISSAKCFNDIKYPGGWSATAAPQDKKGVYDVPEKGILRFAYDAPAPVTPRGDILSTAKAQDWYRKGMIHLGFERCQVLAEALSTCRSDDQISIFLEAVASCFLLKRSHLKLFMEKVPATQYRQVLHRLAPAVGDGSEILEFAQLLRNPDERSRIRADLRTLALLNLRNPTNRYRLLLSNICDYVSAQRLQALAAFEARLQKKSGLPDVSQHGNFEPIRNAKYNGHNIISLSGIDLAHDGILEFDYASVVRMHTGTPEMPDETFEKISAAVASSRASWVDALNAFRTVVDRFAIVSDHIHIIITMFAKLAETQEKAKKRSERSEKRASVKVETLLACFGRCLDMSTLASKALIYDKELFTPKECSELRVRLGSVLVFDWANCHASDSNIPGGFACSSVETFALQKEDIPGGNNYRLDLSKNEEQLLARYLLSIALQEGCDHLDTPEWTEGQLADKPSEKVSEWVTDWLAKFPDSGIFSVTYVMAEDEEVKEATDLSNPRRAVAEEVLGFAPPPALKPSSAG